jgi:hypothetical protein
MPALQQVVRDWLQSLELDHHHIAFDAGRIEELECRARDGFWPHSHNRGGFDLMYMTDLDACYGSGCGPNFGEIDGAIESGLRDSLEAFKREHASDLAGISDDLITYSDLYEMGRSDLATALDEYQRQWLNTPVWWGIRCMYEGADERGVHTLMVYCGANISEYHNAFQKGSATLAEFELRFKTASGLRRQLQRLTSKVNKAF